jgi:hypothetical protein
VAEMRFEIAKSYTKFNLFLYYDDKAFLFRIAFSILVLIQLFSYFEKIQHLEGNTCEY